MRPSQHALEKPTVVVHVSVFALLFVREVELIVVDSQCSAFTYGLMESARAIEPVITSW